MKGARLFLVMAVSAVIALSTLPVPLASAQTQPLLKPNPQIQQPAPQVAPRRTPGLPQRATPRSPGVVLRTHCNGTCMCSGTDCSDKWIADNCKTGSQTCSGSSGEEKICSCVKKAAR